MIIRRVHPSGQVVKPLMELVAKPGEGRDGPNKAGNRHQGLDNIPHNVPMIHKFLLYR